MTFIRIIDMFNIGPVPLQIGVAPPDGTGGTGTGTGTGTDATSVLFNESGLIKLYPGKRFIIEESRVNLGQIQNFIDNKQLNAQFETRTVQDLTARD